MNLLAGSQATDLGPFRAITADALQRLDMRDRNYGWTVEMQVKDEPAALLFTGTVSLAYVVYPDWQSGEPWKLGWGWRALE